MINLRDIADECDGYDAEIEAINERRKDFWAQVREVLPAREVRALKAAASAAGLQGDASPLPIEEQNALDALPAGYTAPTTGPASPSVRQDPGRTFIEPASGQPAAETGEDGGLLIPASDDPSREPSVEQSRSDAEGSSINSDDPGPIPDFLRRVA